MKIFPLVAPLLLLSLPLSAADFTNVKDCATGRKVSDRSGKTGVVTEVRNGMCVVRHDDGSVKNYLHWMLSPAGDARASSSSGLAAGNYVCSASGAGHFKLVMEAGGTYSDRAGKSGRYLITNGNEIEFSSGSLAGKYSRILGPKKFGLSSAKGKSFYTVCNLK